MEIRQLNVKDVFTFGRILGKVGKAGRIQLASALASKGSASEIGMIVFQNLLVEAEDDLKAWFADLVGKEVKEFESLPPVALIEIVENLISQESARDFFLRVSQLVNRQTAT